jgi:hypothetical protein
MRQEGARGTNKLDIMLRTKKRDEDVNDGDEAP